jgi:hypothetical protein
MGAFEIAISVVGVMLTIANLVGSMILRRIFSQLDKLDENIAREGVYRAECQNMLKNELAEETKQRNEDFREMSRDLNEHPKWVDTKEFVKAMVTPIAESQRTIENQMSANTSAVTTLSQSITALIGRLDNGNITLTNKEGK